MKDFWHIDFRVTLGIIVLPLKSELFQKKYCNQDIKYNRQSICRMPAKHHINYAFFLVKLLCEPWIMQNYQEILLKRWYIFRILRHERPFELFSQGYYRVIRNPQSLKVLNGSRIVRIYCKLYAGKRETLQKKNWWSNQNYLFSRLLICSKAQFIKNGLTIAVMSL